MNYKNIPIYRLFNQQINNENHKDVKSLVAGLGALQAQDFNMSKWAIGVRLPGASLSTIDNAIDKAEIVRTHLLRPTWHIVSSDDIYWLLELTGAKIRSAMKFRDKELGLTEKVFMKSNAVIEKALLTSKNLSREELITELERVKISTRDNRASHIFVHAELDGLITSGITKNKKHTFALLEERVPKKNCFTRAEALSELAKRYFTTRGPATLKDFIWWSGLNITEARNALESVKNNFTCETIDSQTFWFGSLAPIPKNEKDRVYLLPAFDEFIISYRDRRPSLILENHSRIISRNGVFKSTVIINGHVGGIWKQTAGKGKIVLEVYLFNSITRKIKTLIENEAIRYSQFLNQKAEIAFKQY